jgi:hypothetical protein
MLTNCLTVIAIDGSVTVARLEESLDLEYHVGDVIPSPEGNGHWRVEEVTLEERCLTVSEIVVAEVVVAEFEPGSVELLAA